MNPETDNSAAADRFGALARRFCSLVDSAGTLDRTDFLLKVYRMLPELIHEAILLPVPRLGDDEEDDDADQEAVPNLRDCEGLVTHQEWRERFTALRDQLGDLDSYRYVFDPTEDTEAIHGSLADDISGIYCDLKDGIKLRDANRAQPDDAIFKWRFDFYSHWGRHAIGALKTIHALLQDIMMDAT